MPLRRVFNDPGDEDPQPKGRGRNSRTQPDYCEAFFRAAAQVNQRTWVAFYYVLVTSIQTRDQDNDVNYDTLAAAVIKKSAGKDTPSDAHSAASGIMTDARASLPPTSGRRLRTTIGFARNVPAPKRTAENRIEAPAAATTSRCSSGTSAVH